MSIEQRIAIKYIKTEQNQENNMKIYSIVN